MAIDDNGGWHISWTWRENWDVVTNHDGCFFPEGETWLISKAQKYKLLVSKTN